MVGRYGMVLYLIYISRKNEGNNNLHVGIDIAHLHFFKFLKGLCDFFKLLFFDFKTCKL